MTGTFQHGDTLACGDREAVRHYENGMLECEEAVPVKDCTKRTNLAYRMTLAITAGVESHLREIGDIVTMIGEWEAASG